MTQLRLENMYSFKKETGPTATTEMAVHEVKENELSKIVENHQTKMESRKKRTRQKSMIK